MKTRAKVPTFNQLINQDPTHTTALRKEFSRRLANRFMILRKAVRIFIVDNDGLNLGNGPSVNKRDLTSVVPMPGRFTFPSSGAKVAAFADWIDEMEKADILTWFERDGQRYLESGYKAGIQRGQVQAKAAGVNLPIAASGDAIGASFAAPIHQDAVELIYTRAFEELKGVTNTMSQQISRTLAQGLTDGLNPLAMAQRMSSKGGPFREAINRSRMLARTEVIRAHGGATLSEFERAGMEGVELETELSLAADACDECESKAAEGPWSIQEARGIIPIHPNCLPGDTPVTAHGVTNASKRWFDGEVVIIRTAGGQDLTCTPNHPILTDGGMVGAGSLDIGSNVVRCSLSHGGLPGVDNDKDVPPLIHEVAESFFRSGKVTPAEVPVSAEHFHGDGEGSKIAIVGTNGLLREDIKPALCKHGRKVSLKVGDPMPAKLPSSGTLALFLKRHMATLRGAVRRTHLIAPFILRHLLPLHLFRSGAATGTDARFIEALPDGPAAARKRICKGFLRRSRDVATNNLASGQGDAFAVSHFDAVFNQPPDNGLAGYAAFISEALSAPASSVFTDKVVNIERVYFSGHVFNLETVSGIYMAKDIVTHNCRCAYRPVVK